MAFLNMEQQTWAFTFGILGNIISLMVFLSPLPTFYRVFRKKSTEGFQSTPYVVTLFSCMLWIFYALLKSGAELLVTINGVGCVIEAVYIAMYLAYAPRPARVLTAKMLLGLNVGVFGLVALVTMLLSSKPATLRVHVLGWICVSVALSVFAAPLSIMRQVIRTKSVEFMPFSLSFFLVLSAVIWFAYGALKKDVFVAFPNVLGFVFGLAQMALYMAYRNGKPASAAVVMAEEVKLPEHCANKEAAAAPPHEGSRASCGAEVHPIDILPAAAEVEPPVAAAVVAVAAPEPQVAVAIDVVEPVPVTCTAAAELPVIKPDTAIAVEV
ncbi:unnamed protein product [Urochloa humidicola]